MKKILLVNTNREKIPYPVPPIGLCYLAGFLEKKYEVKIFDGMFQEPEKVLDVIKEFKPDFIGFSMRNIDNIIMFAPYCFVDEINDNFVKPVKAATDVPLIFGGSGFSMYPEYLMKKFGVDYGVVGEGEIAFPKLLDYLSEGKDPSEIERVITKERLTYTTPAESFNIKNQIFSEIDKRIDFSLYSEKSVYSIQTKRGCYHKCIYCSYPHIEGSLFRPRDPKDVADEIAAAYHRLGTITFEFVDSTFNDPAGHAEEICKEIIKRNIKVNLRTMGMNPVNVSKNLLELMLKAGFTQIDCTPDSASPTMIKSMKKNFTYEELTRSAKIIKELDMPTMWFFIFGGPEEDERTLLESFEFIDRWVNEFDMVHITTGLRIYPNTDLYDIAVTEGVIRKDDPIIEPVYYLTNKISLERLREIIKRETANRINCIPAEDSKPSKQIFDMAVRMKEKYNLTEPFFRILLRIRYKILKNNFTVKL